MPRAFLITNKRYKSAVDYEDHQISRETSPERTVCTAEGRLPNSTETSDSDEPGLYVDDLQPTSPHSPAHESRGAGGGGSPPAAPLFRTLEYCPVQYRSATALVSVIRQLMQQPARTPPPTTTTTQLSGNAEIGGVSSCHHHHPSQPQQQQHQHSQQDSHACAECGKRYSTSSNLARHRQTHRSPTDKKARQCPHCDKVYVSVPAYSMHVRTHSQGCRCPYCGKGFSRPWLLQGHIRTHTGEKPFACPLCRKAFADKSNLRAHVQTHSSSKPHTCRRCGKAFALKSYLYKHEESSCMRLHHHGQPGADKSRDSGSGSGSGNEDGPFLQQDVVLNLVKEEETRSAVVVG